MTAETVKTNTPDTAPASVPVPAPFTRETARRLAIAEGIGHAAAGIAATFGPQLDSGLLDLGVAAAGAGVVWRLWRRTRDEDRGRLLASCQRSLPLLGLSGCWAAAALVPGAAWWEYAAPLAVGAVSALTAPLTRSRGVQHHVETLADVIDEQGEHLGQTVTAEGPADPYADGLARLWDASPSTGATALTQISYDEDAPDFEGVIVAPAGQAVPASIDERAVAAVFDVPVEAVALAAVDGAGPGRQSVRVAPTLAVQAAVDVSKMPADDAVQHVWATRVADPHTGVAPGMHLVEHAFDGNRLRLRVEAEDGRMIHLPRVPITRALKPLGVTDSELVVTETDELGAGIVSIYREHPLISIREATVEDLTMDADGQIAIGLRHDGRLSRWPLYDPELGAVTDLVVGAMGSGKSVTLNHLLAAERISGVVSIVADAQQGMSLPEARGRVYHFGAGIAALGATLAAACAVGDYREEVSAARGWGAFKIGDPWPLFNITLDELNKVLGSDADVPREFRTWVTGLISHFQTTGRKFGGGLRFAGQSIHVADLGDAEKIRANAKNGSVWLGRVNSSLTQSMASDMAADASEITPIRKHFTSAAAELEAAWSGEEAPKGPLTAGRAWLLQGGRASSMRTFKAVKEDRTFPHLIELYESAPILTLTEKEDAIFKGAYEEALYVAERLLAGEDPYGDDEGQDDGEGGKKGAKPKSGRISVPAAPSTLGDLVLKALADGPRKTREIRKAVGVGEEGGPASGSVDNALSKLAEQGDVVRVGHGTWGLPPNEDEDD